MGEFTICKYSVNLILKLHVRVQLFAVFEGIVKGTFYVPFIQKKTAASNGCLHPDYFFTT